MSRGLPLDPDVVVPLETGADVDNHSELGFDAGSELLDVARRRQDISGIQHALIILDGWAVDDRYGPIAESKALLVEDVVDYSQKAYKCEGAYTIDVQAVLNDPDQAFTKVISVVDEEDFEQGTKYLPKKAVDMVGSVEPQT